MTLVADQAPASSAYSSLLSLAQETSATSEAAEVVRSAAASVVESGERSVALFGAKESVISRIWELVLESDQEDEEDRVGDETAHRAADFIRLLPDDLPLPEVGTEPDGYLSLDWMRSRHRVFSVSFGPSPRLPYAWLDGADRGHAVARFDGATVPPRIADGVRRIMRGGSATVWPA
jgi:hypothetical protein